jgi:putative ABC transport system permease protein
MRDMVGVIKDFRLAARMLRKTPGFTLAAVVSLALGIGANTAIFQLINAVRLKTLPVRAPQELSEVRIADMSGARGSFSFRYNSVTNPIWEQIRDHQQTFTGIVAWSPTGFNMAQGGEVRDAKGLWVSGDFFNVLGVRPQKGRLFSASEDVRGCPASGVVISDGFWQSEFGAAADVIGRKLTIADHSLEIIGVTPPGFYGLEVGRSFDLAVPICAEAALRGKNSRLDSGTSWWLMVTGRLRSGVTLAQANASLQSVSPAIFQTSLPGNYPAANIKDYLGFRLEAVSAASGYSALREDYEYPLWLLLSIAGLVLLIACANLANLLLARASMREREMAVRQAMGASRARLIPQLLAESLLLAGMGTVLGGFLAQSLSRFLITLISTAGNAIILDLSFDWRLLGFAAAIAIFTCILFGLTPALKATRVQPSAAMKASGRGVTAGRERISLRRALVVVQVALSLVLVAGALLFTRSLTKLGNTSTGFQQQGILITQAGFAHLNLPPGQRVAYRWQLLDRIRAIPGVESAADASVVPLSGDSTENNVWPDGHREAPAPVMLSWVGPSYFGTLRTPLIGGRDFNAHDNASAPRMAIVNETFARKVFYGANPIGQRFWRELTPTDPEEVFEIVGLVRDTKYQDLREQFSPIAFMPTSQEGRPDAAGQFVVRSSLPESQITAAIRAAMAEVNPRLNLRFQNFKSMISEGLLRDRLMATLSGFFGLLALVLASVGLYGILSYGVASRRNEIGIRMALGAQARDVLSMILREGVVLASVGIAVGLPFVFGATRFARSMLFNLSPMDPLSLTGAALFLFAVAIVAGLIPARRAAKVDPLVALRYE